MVSQKVLVLMKGKNSCIGLDVLILLVSLLVLSTILTILMVILPLYDQSYLFLPSLIEVKKATHGSSLQFPNFIGNYQHQVFEFTNLQIGTVPPVVATPLFLYSSTGKLHRAAISEVAANLL